MVGGNAQVDFGKSQRSEKKCPNCGKWTQWKLQAEDVCEHCGQLLSTHIQEKEERGQRILSAPAGLFPVKPTDHPVLRFGKVTVNIVHMIFTAFMSFVIWFITVVVA